MPTFLNVSNLTKAYPGPNDILDNLVFSNLSLTVDRGSNLALVGPSGSGKSTLLNLIAGLDRPTSGEVWVNGESVHNLNEEEAARFRNLTLGFIFQSHHLLPALSVRENVMLPALAGHGGLRGQALQNRAEELLDRVGLSHRLSHLPGQLSGGEKQRVAVARSLINQPSLVLADEPTGSLDYVNAESLMKLLLELNEDLETTLIIVTHAIPLAQKMDQIWSFSEGKLMKEEL